MSALSNLYYAVIDFHAYGTQVSINDAVCGGALVQEANAHTANNNAMKFMATESIGVPEAVIRKFTLASAQAAYYMAKSAYKAAELREGASHKVALSITGSEDDGTAYIGIAQQSFNQAGSEPEVTVYKYCKGDTVAADNFILGRAVNALLCLSQYKEPKAEKIQAIYRLKNS